MLAVRIGQLTAEVFHLLDLQPCWLLRHPRHPAISATGHLTFVREGLTPADHTRHTGSQLPDGPISRVRLTTMTIPARSSLARRDLSAHSHTPLARQVYRTAR